MRISWILTIYYSNTSHYIFGLQFLFHNNPLDAILNTGSPHMKRFALQFKPCSSFCSSALISICSFIVIFGARHCCSFPLKVYDVGQIMAQCRAILKKKNWSKDWEVIFIWVNKFRQYKRKMQKQRQITKNSPVQVRKQSFKCTSD